MMRKQRALITGGAGYIGSLLTKRLLSWGYEVTVLDNLMYPDSKFSLLGYTNDPGFTFVRGDVRNEKLLLELMKKADLILPLAALVGFPLCEKDPKAAWDINFGHNKFIAENKSNEQLVIYFCTNSGYGSTTDGICTEESPMNPISVYGESKVAAEKVYQETDMCITLRLATVFGPSARIRTDLLVNNFVLKAMKDRAIVLFESEFMRNYIHVEDICRVVIHLVDRADKLKNQTFNVGNDALNMNKLQLAEAIKNQISFEIIRAEINSDPDKRNYVVSSQKLYNTGFECYYNLDSGIEGLIKAYSMIDEPWHANY